MKYNSRKFKVLINAKTDSIESGQDDYQYEEISKDIIDYIYTLTGNKPYKYYLEYKALNDKNFYKINNITKEYYTGDNLDKCVKDIRLVVSYIDDVNLEKIKNEKFDEFGSFSYIVLAQYNSKEAYDNTQRPKYNITGSISDDDFKENSQNLKKVLWYKFGQNNYYDF